MLGQKILLIALAFWLLQGSLLAQNVGIGTNNPLSKLVVKGNATIGSSYTGMAAPTDGLAVQGRLGVGTLTPGTKFAVNGNAAIGTSYSTVAGPTNGLIVQNRIGIGVTNPLSNFVVNGNASIGYTVGASPSNSLTISNLLGIGTNSPQEKLHMKTSGSTRLLIEGDQRGYVNAAVVLRANQSGLNKRGLGIFMYDRYSKNEWYIGRPYSSSDRIVFQRQTNLNTHDDQVSAIVDGSGNTTLTERIMVIDGSGDVGIGVNFPSDKLVVNGTASKPGGGSWAVFSDQRLKTDIQNYEDGLAQILKIRPVSFKYKSEYQIGEKGKSYIGILAQDMQKLAPYMVEEKKVSSDAEETYLQFDPSALNFMLINAVQDLHKENEELKERIERLEQLMNK